MKVFISGCLLYSKRRYDALGASGQMEELNSKFAESIEIESGGRFYKNRPIKTLISLYKGNYLRIFLSAVFFFVKHTPVWVLPIVMANIINAVTENAANQGHVIFVNVGVLVICVLCNVPAAVLYSRFISLATRQVEAEIRMSLVKKLQVLSISYHKHLQAGRLQSKVLRDVEAITALCSRFCQSIMPIMINLVVVFGVTLSKSPIIALFYLGSVPICFLVAKVFKGNIRSTNRVFRKDIEEMSATVAQMVEMVPITRAHALEDVEIEKVDHTLSKVQKNGYRIDVLNTFFGAVSWSVFQIVQVLCLLFTAFLASKKQIEIGDIVVYQTYFSTLLNQLNSAINIYPDIVKGMESTVSVGEIFLVEDVEKHTGKPKVKDVQGNFEFKDISFKYDDGEDYVLKNFNLSVKKGECIAFVGESGGGKTTLLNLVIGFMHPTYGQLLLDGTDMSAIDLHSYRKHIAVVPQNTILFSGSIRDNITYGIPNVSEENLQEVIEIAYLREVIDKLPHGLDTLVGEHGDILSGGQKQRIAIARALIRNPEIIILDEATSALDNQSEIHIQKAMKNLIKGRTTFVVAHRLSTIVDSDRIVVVEGGKVVESGDYKTLMEQKGAFYQLAHARIG